MKKLLLDISLRKRRIVSSFQNMRTQIWKQIHTNTQVKKPAIVAQISTVIFSSGFTVLNIETKFRSGKTHQISQRSIRRPCCGIRMERRRVEGSFVWAIHRSLRLPYLRGWRTSRSYPHLGNDHQCVVVMYSRLFNARAFTSRSIHDTTPSRNNNFKVVGFILLRCSLQERTAIFYQVAIRAG